MQYPTVKYGSHTTIRLCISLTFFLALLPSFKRVLSVSLCSKFLILFASVRELHILRSFVAERKREEETEFGAREAITSNNHICSSTKRITTYKDDQIYIEVLKTVWDMHITATLDLRSRIHADHVLPSLAPNLTYPLSSYHNVMNLKVQRD